MVSRVVTQPTAPTSTTTLYAYDLADHPVVEFDGNGVTQREYVWLDDMPVALVDMTGGTPAVSYIHVDQLMRPINLSNASQLTWSAAYKPFGEVALVQSVGGATIALRFPGQWYQSENGLHANWHRHYDPTLGRYIQPDPLVVDGGAAVVAGLPEGTLPGASDGHAAARSMGWQEAHDIIMHGAPARAMLQDGPSIYGYAGQSPLVKTDPTGLGLWNWIQKNFSAPTDACTPSVPQCPPCDPPVGTVCYDTQTGHTHNGWDPHHHLYFRNQNKITCQCFWNKGSGTGGTTEFPPLGASPCAFYPTWPAN